MDGEVSLFPQYISVLHQGLGPFVITSLGQFPLKPNRGEVALRMVVAWRNVRQASV